MTSFLVILGLVAVILVATLKYSRHRYLRERAEEAQEIPRPQSPWHGDSLLTGSFLTANSPRPRSLWYKIWQAVGRTHERAKNFRRTRLRSKAERQVDKQAMEILRNMFPSSILRKPKE